MRKRSSSTMLGAVLLFFLLFAAWVSAQDSRNESKRKFQRGYSAFYDEEWAQAAQLMAEAQELWPEDGRKIKNYGGWFDQYLPLYYLGVALYELGCFKEAKHYLERSLLSKESIRVTESDLERFRSVQDDCDRYLHAGIEARNPDVCSQWQIDGEKDRNKSPPKPGEEQGENEVDSQACHER